MSDEEIIIAAIIKPCARLTAEEVAEKWYQAALSGVRFIKDGEKMLGPEYCRLEKKAKLVSEKLKQAHEEKDGRQCMPLIYC